MAYRLLVNRRSFFIALVPLLFGAILLAAPAQAEKINTDMGVAIHGHDAVAYLTDDAAVMGSDQFTAGHQGATYKFASAANRDRFITDPQEYLPAYGGYCAYAVSKGATADIDPEAFTVYDDKLYLNYSKAVRETWRQDIPGNIAKADANWPKLQ